MGIENLKEVIKDEILSIDVIDLEGSINTKGNYLYLSGFSGINPLEGDFEFTLVLAAASLNGSTDSLEPIFDKVIKDVHKYSISEGEEINLKMKIIKKDDLYMYEIKFVLENKIN